MTEEIKPDYLSDIDWEIRQLMKQATRHKDVKEWISAIECLQEAENLMPQSDTEYTIQDYLRRPLFLQQAGLYDKAIEAFNDLLETIPEPFARAKVYDKIRLACWREKELETMFEAGLYANAWAYIAELRRHNIPIQQAKDFIKKFEGRRRQMPTLERNKKRLKELQKMQQEPVPIEPFIDSVSKLSKKAKIKNPDELIRFLQNNFADINESNVNDILSQALNKI